MQMCEMWRWEEKKRVKAMLKAELCLKVGVGAGNFWHVIDREIEENIFVIPFQLLLRQHSFTVCLPGRSNNSCLFVHMQTNTYKQRYFSNSPHKRALKMKYTVLLKHCPGQMTMMFFLCSTVPPSLPAILLHHLFAQSPCGTLLFAFLLLS